MSFKPSVKWCIWSQCNIPGFGYDRGNFGSCAPRCFYEMLGKEVCDEAYSREECQYVEFVYGWCARGYYERMKEIKCIRMPKTVALI